LEAIAPHVVTLDDAGFEGELYLPRAADRFEVCVIVLAGSGGGLSHRDSAKALAKEGVPSLAVAYFNHGKLPRKLERIPLEYFERVAEWLASRRELRGARQVLMGRSRGAELCLQLAASYALYEGVIATSPSHVLWPGMGSPAWTFRDQDLPAVLNRTEEAPAPPVEHVDGKAYMILKDQCHFHLQDNPAVEAATIAVERIKGPVLLFSGLDDMLWPSSFFADQIERRALSRGFRFPLQNVQYEGVGHDFPLPGQQPTLRVAHPRAPSGVTYGGRADQIIRAAEDRWRRILAFLGVASS
jgi:pimeloyl-ACP methyl ester carboxylesterase